jgi:hypothetical protein
LYRLLLIIYTNSPIYALMSSAKKFGFKMSFFRNGSVLICV